MKEYVKPTITEIIDGLECVDLKSGENILKLDYGMFWKGHDSGTKSMIGAIIHTSCATEKVSGYLVYIGPGKMKFAEENPADGRNHNIVISEAWENAFRFTADLYVSENNDVELGFGGFSFYDDFSNLKDSRGDGMHFGSYQYIEPGDGDHARTIEDCQYSTAGRVLKISFD